ncbi:MAG: hypothetical protein K0R65_1521 [Crocinitomicaceae bacterium]|jgi:hypothetical protein|nr:hypothetical protein [Crocinitomicaceae bacterium]
MKTLIPLVICLLISFSCTKESIRSQSKNALSSTQKEELSELKLELKSEKNQNEKSSTGIQPNSDENYMDAYGQNFENALLLANELNSTYDNNITSEDAFEKWKNDLTNKYQEGLSTLTNKPNENVLFSLYAETIHDLYLTNFETANNQNQLIAHTKIFERYICKSDFLTTEEKDALLMEISILKYNIYSIYEHGIVVNGTNFNDQINAVPLWDCVGQQVRNVYKKFGSKAGYLICISLGDSFIAYCLAYILFHG